MVTNEKIIISPSGNFYGSEQILHDYLSCSTKEYYIFLPKGHLYRELKKLNRKLNMRIFSNVKILYIRLFFICLLNPIKSIYSNEAGHNKYILLLARIFPKIRFIIHLRILEDTSAERWRGSLPHNVIVITYSFLQNTFPHKSIALRDPYPFQENDNIKRLELKPNKPMQIGIIGRITRAKGVDSLLEIIRRCHKIGLEHEFIFKFFGDASDDVIKTSRLDELRSYKNVKIMGFVESKQKIYTSIHCVLHGAEKEPLGRIYLEAIDFGIPLVGFDSGGIGKTGNSLNLSDFLVNRKNESDIADSFIDKLQIIRSNYEPNLEIIQAAKIKAMRLFDLHNYTKIIDKILDR